MPKKATDQTLIGEQGVALIAGAVGQMGHLWHPTSGADSGIDGDIELRDPATGQVRNVRIAVQSKATERRWPAEDDDGFSFSPSYDDIEYWLSSNQPVIVVCSRPSDGEAYWRSVQEWAVDPTRRAERTIRFDKHRDRFDKSARDLLFDLRATEHDRVEPPGPPPEPETALANFMPIRWQSDVVWSADVAGRDPASLLAAAREAGASHSGLAFHDGRIWSLREPAEPFLAAIAATDPQVTPLAELSESDDRSDLDLLRQLVRHDLIDRHDYWLRWHAQKRCAYFRRRGDQEAVAFSWATRPGRTVVTPQYAKTGGHFTGYRHDAARLHVRRVGGGLHLQLSPSYLFTWDGKQVSGHHDRALAGIKRKDRHASVSQMLRMWAHLFTDEATMAGLAHPFTLGPLVEVEVPRGIPDRGWQEVSPDDLGVDADDEFLPIDVEDEDDELRLFDEDAERG